MLMILCLEIIYGRYLNNIANMFREADEKHEVSIPRKSTPVHVIKIEDETNERSSERKNEINIINVNDKLELNKIENEKIIVINDDVFPKYY
jgi:hypothetical protein